MLKICLIYFLIFVAIGGLEAITIERNENYLFEKNDHQKLLSRRRRYLTFPEGSSLQLGELNRNMFEKHKDIFF